MKSILYVQYLNPSLYPPLEHSSKILANSGWTVTFLGIRASADSNAIRFEPHPHIRVHLMPYYPPGWGQKVHYLCFVLWVLSYRLIYRPTVVYASDALSYPIGYILSRWMNTRVVMHEHDTHLSLKGSIGRFIAWCRKRLAKYATAVVCPQVDRAKAITATLQPRKLFVVYNCPELSEYKPPITKTNDKLRLWFHGSIVPTQLPMCIIDAMRRCSFPVQLEVAGYETIGHPGYVTDFLEFARQSGLDHSVIYHGAIPQRRDMLNRASQSHLGLTLFSRNFREPMVGASNKPFDYLASGLVLLVPDTQEWHEFFVARNCAIACDPEDGKLIACALEWCWKNLEQFPALSANARAMLVHEWNYESQFEPVRNLMEELATAAYSK